MAWMELFVTGASSPCAQNPNHDTVKLRTILWHLQGSDIYKKCLKKGKVIGGFEHCPLGKGAEICACLGEPQDVGIQVSAQHFPP